jgi:hypothetical protein
MWRGIPFTLIAALAILAAGDRVEGLRLAPQGAWLSLIADLSWIALVCRREWQIAQIRKTPWKFPGRLVVAHFPVELRFTHLIPELARGWMGDCLWLSPKEFASSFDNSPKGVDMILPTPQTLKAAGISLEAAQSIPHFPVFRASPSVEPFVFKKEWIEEVARSNRWNRLLHHQLPPDLWQASVNLSSTTPRIIAERWKSFHFQDDLRGRLTALMNTMDLLQRWLGTMVFATLRKKGVLYQEMSDGTFLKDGQFAAWNKMLEKVLAKQQGVELEGFCTAMLEPQQGFDEDMELLVDYWRFLGTSPRNDKRNLLQAWSAIWFLRNQLLAHGSLGWELQFDPEPYLRGIYLYFLRQASRVVSLVPRLLAYPGKYAEGFDKKRAWSMDAGILGWHPRSLAKDCAYETILVISAKHQAVGTDPFLRIHNGRTVVLNRLLKKDQAEYIDFEGAQVLESSFVLLPANLDDFVGPQH